MKNFTKNEIQAIKKLRRAFEKMPNTLITMYDFDNREIYVFKNEDSSDVGEYIGFVPLIIFPRKIA